MLFAIAFGLTTCWLPVARAQEPVTLTAGGLQATFDLAGPGLTALASSDGAVTWTTSPTTISLKVEDDWLQTGSGLPFVSAHRLPGAAVEITWANDVWELTETWQAVAEPGYLIRSLLITRRGTGEELKIRGLRLSLTGLDPAAELWRRNYLALLHDAPAGRGLHLLMDDRDEYGDQAAQKSEDGTFRVDCDPSFLARMLPGDRQVFTCQVLREERGDLLQCKRQGFDLFADRGLLPPANRPADAADSIIYSCHPGGHIDTWFQDVGGFDNLQRWLPAIERLGADTLWLLPTFTYCVDGKLGQGCPYGPSDFWTQEIALGGDDAARRFVEAAHARDMRVLFDLVPHGGSYVDRARHPNWICRDPEGKPIEWFGAGCDFSAAGYQRDMRDIAQHTVAQFGIDGFRVDCAGGGPANWSAEAKRVSQSTLAGAVGMNAAMRQGFELARPGDSPYIFPEEWAGHQAFSPVVDVEYGGPMYWMVEALRKSHVNPAQWGPRIQQWLSDEFYASPPGSLRARFITNHDMDRDNGPVNLAWGLACGRAMMAVCFGAQGVPFIYQEQEVGSGPYYSRLAALRRALPELRRGEPDYDSATSPDLFCCLRSLDDQATLVLVNLTPQAGPREVSLTHAPLRGSFLALDAFSGEDLPAIAQSPTSFSVDMPAFGARFIALRSDAAGLTAVRRDLGPQSPSEAPAAAELTTSAEPAGLSVTAPLPASLTVTSTLAEGDRLTHATLSDGRLGDLAAAKLTSRTDGHDTLFELTLTPSRELTSRAGASLEVALTSPAIARWFAIAADGLWEDWQQDRHFNWSEGGGYGYGPGITHQGRMLTDRLYESGIWPLHSTHPWVALSGPGSSLLALTVESVTGLPAGFPQPNIYYSDGSSAALAVREPGWRVALVDRWYPGRPEHGPRVVGAAPPPTVWRAGLPVTLTLRLRAETLPATGDATSGAAPLLRAITGSPDLAWDDLSRNEQFALPGSDESVSRGMASMTWGAFQTMRLGWRVPLNHPGIQRLWVRARNSEVAASGRDLCDKYRFTLNGQPVEPTWEALGTERVGDNGYIGWLSLPVPADAGPSIDLWLQTTADWCAVDEAFILSTDPSWAPEAVARYRTENAAPGGPK